MLPLKTALWELKAGISKVIIFDILLNSIIVFLLSYLVCALFVIPVKIPLAIAVAYVVVELARRLSINKLRQAEYHYPELNERLRTSAEYANVENPVVNELRQEVLMKMRIVEEAEFMDEKQVLAKSGVIALLCFLILLAAPVILKVDAIEPALQKARQISEGNITFEVPNDAPVSGTFGGKSGAGKIGQENDIYGVPMIAKLGDEEVRMILRPSGDSVNIRERKDVEKKEFSESYPKEVFAVSSASYDEKIPKEQQEIVKNYFTQIAKE